MNVKYGMRENIDKYAYKNVKMLLKKMFFIFNVKRKVRIFDDTYK